MASLTVLDVVNGPGVKRREVDLVDGVEMASLSVAVENENDKAENGKVANGKAENGNAFFINLVSKWSCRRNMFQCLNFLNVRFYKNIQKIRGVVLIYIRKV